MKAVSRLHDARINSDNILVEMTFEDYAAIARDITGKNDLQRRRVGSSRTVYSLLKQDLLKDCVIPPVVLALTSEASMFDDKPLDDFPAHVLENKDNLVILDGLQRTYTILDLLDELAKAGDGDALDRVGGNKLRVEFYVGINRIGILYRMLTLNTGQTPMSLRHQIEILYSDYLKQEIQGIKLLREVDGSKSQVGEYNFKDAVEGFNAYINRDELPMEKADILENINGLERLSRENQDKDIFKQYITSWDNFIRKMANVCKVKLSDEYVEQNGTPFGMNASQVFKKPQAMSGFGAAVGKMIDLKLVGAFEDVDVIVGKIILIDEDAFLESINNSLAWIKSNAKKIGNAQRSYFQFFFRELINGDSDSYLNLEKSAVSALRKYQSQNF